MEKRAGALWVAIAIALLVVAAIYLLGGLASGHAIAEDWADVAIPILAASVAAAVIGWRVGARRATEAVEETERDAQALRDRVVELERELERLGPR